MDAWYVQINSEEIIPSKSSYDSWFRLYPEYLFKFKEESLRIRWSSPCPSPLPRSQKLPTSDVKYDEVNFIKIEFNSFYSTRLSEPKKRNEWILN